MSAITKPLVNFTNAINNTTYVGVEHINTVEKLNVAALPNQPASTAKYLIVITYQYPNGFTKKTEIKFATSGARDTSFGNLQTAISTAVA